MGCYSYYCPICKQVENVEHKKYQVTTVSCKKCNYKMIRCIQQNADRDKEIKSSSYTS